MGPKMSQTRRSLSPFWTAPAWSGPAWPGYKPPPPVPHHLLTATPLPDASSDLSLLARAEDSCHVTRDSSCASAVGTEQA